MYTQNHKTKYINVGIITDNSYLGWKKPKKDTQYVTIENGEISWYYDFINGEWVKRNSEGTAFPMVEAALKDIKSMILTLKVNNENYGEICATPKNLKGEYDSHTGIINSENTDKVVMTLSASPEKGYEVAKWKVGNNTVSNSSGKKTIEVEVKEDSVYEVIFKKSKS